METPTSAAQQGEHCIPADYTVFWGYPGWSYKTV